MTAPGDFLTPQAKPFYERLRALGVPAEYHSYGDSENELRHVFHIDMRLPEAHRCNGEECAYFQSLIKP